MWNIAVIINSVFLALSTVFFIYSIGAALILGQWKLLLLAFLLFVFLGITQIVLAALNM